MPSRPGETAYPVVPGRSALPAALRAAMQASSVDGRPPNIVVYLVDTLRADHLGAYGYERPTSPFLDAMSTEGVIFDHPMAQSGWTRTSVASILTGLGPRSHSVLERDDSLSAEAVTMQKLLGHNGYQTYAVITNINVTSRFGFDVGFDAVEVLPLRVPLGANQGVQDAELSDRVNDHFFAWLARRQTDRPFFAYLHTMDPHHPYTPPEPYRSRFVADSPLARNSDGLLISPPTPAVAGLFHRRGSASRNGPLRWRDRPQRRAVRGSCSIACESSASTTRPSSCSCPITVKSSTTTGDSGTGGRLYSEMIFVPAGDQVPGRLGCRHARHRPRSACRSPADDSRSGG